MHSKMRTFILFLTFSSPPNLFCNSSANTMAAHCHKKLSIHDCPPTNHISCFHPFQVNLWVTSTKGPAITSDPTSLFLYVRSFSKHHGTISCTPSRTCTSSKGPVDVHSGSRTVKDQPSIPSSTSRARVRLEASCR